MKFPGAGGILTLPPGKLEPLGTMAPGCPSLSGIEIITPLLVPIHNLLHDIRRVVIRMSENPNFPVPETDKSKSKRKWV